MSERAGPQFENWVKVGDVLAVVEAVLKDRFPNNPDVVDRVMSGVSIKLADKLMDNPDRSEDDDWSYPGGLPGN